LSIGYISGEALVARVVTLKLLQMCQRLPVSIPLKN